MKTERLKPPMCHCREPMKLIRTIPHIEGLPELLVFFCNRASPQKPRCERTRRDVHDETP
jgi:hypothetical protein